MGLDSDWAISRPKKKLTCKSRQYWVMPMFSSQDLAVCTLIFYTVSLSFVISNPLLSVSVIIYNSFPSLLAADYCFWAHWQFIMPVLKRYICKCLLNNVSTSSSGTRGLRICQRNHVSVNNHAVLNTRLKKKKDTSFHITLLCLATDRYSVTLHKAISLLERKHPFLSCHFLYLAVGGRISILVQHTNIYTYRGPFRKYWSSRTYELINSRKRGHQYPAVIWRNFRG